MHVKKILAILSLIILSPSTFANDFKPDDVLGFWLSESGKGVIEIYKNGVTYEGKLVWIKDIHTGKLKEKLDKNNPEKEKQSRSLLGIVNLTGFKFDEGEWSGGKIYDPEKGKTYKAYMKLEDKNSLKLRGYIGFALIGRTTEWKRQKSAVPDEYQTKESPEKSSTK